MEGSIKLSLAVLSFGLVLFSAPQALASPSCSARFQEVRYIGNFNAGRAMRIKVGTVKNANGSLTESAQIWSGRTCAAVCQASQSEGTVELRCNGVQFEALSTPATLFLLADWKGASTLRFGSWLGGYQDVAVKPELNRYSGNPRIATR